MTNALTPPFLDASPKTAASKDKEEEEIVAVEKHNNKVQHNFPNETKKILSLQGQIKKVKILV